MYFQVGHPGESTFPNRALRGFNEDSIHAQCLKCILCVAFDLNLVSSQCTLKRETICTMHNTVKALLSSPTLQYGLRNANLDENLSHAYFWTNDNSSTLFHMMEQDWNCVPIFIKSWQIYIYSFENSMFFFLENSAQDNFCLWWEILSFISSSIHDITA